jgi:hypothetical protein
LSELAGIGFATSIPVATLAFPGEHVFQDVGRCDPSLGDIRPWDPLGAHGRQLHRSNGNRRLRSLRGGADPEPGRGPRLDPALDGAAKEVSTRVRTASDEMAAVLRKTGQFEVLSYSTDPSKDGPFCNLARRLLGNPDAPAPPCTGTSRRPRCLRSILHGGFSVTQEPPIHPERRLLVIPGVEGEHGSA